MKKIQIIFLVLLCGINYTIASMFNVDLGIARATTDCSYLVDNYSIPMFHTSVCCFDAGCPEAQNNSCCVAEACCIGFYCKLSNPVRVSQTKAEQPDPSNDLQVCQAQEYIPVLQSMERSLPLTDKTAFASAPLAQAIEE